MNASTETVLICTSPKAGSGQQSGLVPELADGLRARALDVRVTSDIEQVQSGAEDLHSKGALKAVVAAGGDGTLSLVISRVPVGVPVMPLPLGTENLMARYLGHRPSAADAVDTILQQRTVTMDAASANDRLFLIMCSCGFDAEVVRRLHTTRKGHIWRLSYAAPTILSMVAYQFPQLRLNGNGQGEPSSPSRWAFVFNVPRYAGGLQIGSWADATDGWLDGISLDKGSVLHCIRYIYHAFLGSHRSLKGTVVSRCKRYSIDPVDPSERIPYQLDGDFVGYLPVEIRIHPARVQMLLPQGCKVPLASANQTNDSSSRPMLAAEVPWPAPVSSSNVDTSR